MGIIKNLGIMLIGLYLTINLSSCYTPIEGCLDPESINYSIEGDEDCDDCCVYPTIKVSIFHQNTDTTLNLKDTLLNNLNQEYSIIDYVYLLSDFKMENPDGVTYEVEDSIQLDTDDGNTWTKDDVIRVERSTFSYTYGTVIFDGLVNQLSFKIGISALLNDNRFTVENSSHPLITDPDSLFQEDLDQFVFQRIKIAHGEEFKDTIVYDVSGNENLQSITFPIEFESDKAKDKTIIIEARYNEWFEDVDFLMMTKEEIEAMIAIKSAGMFGPHE